MKMNQEKCSIKCHTFSDHLKSMMKDLMMNEDLSDVTLVTEDKKQIKAHLHILRTFSPVFKDIFMKEKNSHQTMYLRGVQYSELESVMQFIYLGEATLNEERMDEFLAVAKSLEIKDLYMAEIETNVEPKNEAIPFDLVTSPEKSGEQNLIPDPDKIFREALLFREEIRGVKFACDHCPYQTTEKNYLTKHIVSKHKGKFACNQCNYRATRQDAIRIHFQSKHKGFKYSCDQFDTQ